MSPMNRRHRGPNERQRFLIGRWRASVQQSRTANHRSRAANHQSRDRTTEAGPRTIQAGSEPPKPRRERPKAAREFETLTATLDSGSRRHRRGAPSADSILKSTVSDGPPLLRDCRSTKKVNRQFVQRPARQMLPDLVRHRPLAGEVAPILRSLERSPSVFP